MLGHQEIPVLQVWFIIWCWLYSIVAIAWFKREVSTVYHKITFGVFSSPLGTCKTLKDRLGSLEK